MTDKNKQTNKTKQKISQEMSFNYSSFQIKRYFHSTKKQTQLSKNIFSFKKSMINHIQYATSILLSEKQIKHKKKTKQKEK